MEINTLQVDQALQLLAERNEKRFNAYQVTSLANELDVSAVNDYLLFKSEGRFAILSAKIETLCEANNHPDEHFEIGEEFPDYEIECRICGDEYIPDLNNSHLVFYFKESFLDGVKKKQLNLTSRLVAI